MRFHILKSLNLFIVALGKATASYYRSSPRPVGVPFILNMHHSSIIPVAAIYVPSWNSSSCASLRPLHTYILYDVQEAQVLRSQGC